jgi:hypothetical protein
MVISRLAAWLLQPIFMEQIKHLKIETATPFFSKFTHMQENMFDSCMHSFFTRPDVGWWRTRQPSLEIGWARRARPGRRGGWPGLHLTI